MGAPSYADDDTDQLLRRVIDIENDLVLRRAVEQAARGTLATALGDGSARQWEPDTGR
jgi:hypothetical protein